MIDTGSRIKKLRTDNQMTLEELADKINDKFGTALTKGMISRWENNLTDPILEHMRVIAMYFDCSLDYLLYLSDEAKPTILKKFPTRFTKPDEARAFLSLTTVFTQDGYDIGLLNDDDVISFANDVIAQVRLISYKYLK